MQKIVNACDFSYFCSIAAPDAPEDRLRTVCDWGNWVFPFDDMFDSGPLRSDPDASRKVLDSLLANMLGNRSYVGVKMPVVQVHDNIFRRLSEVSHESSGVQRRFAKSMEFYAEGVAMQVEAFTSQRLPSLQEILQTRRRSVGVEPLYHLVEYAHSLRVPDEVFEDPEIQALERIGADFVILSNDILSYRKEEAEGCHSNMVAACRMTGKSAQEAFDMVGALLEESYIEWDDAMSRVPRCGGDIDREVERYIKGIQDVVQANISWSLQSKRYFGADGPKVRRTRMVDVLVDPPYLSDLQEAEF
ncbi:terpene synthase metal binding domain-containing protein [Colletotrichum plurivorum]|uniref:Terpene synthase n=1 Tax=Colletotrichum plurivorum TaxID=2175906 RepID=A0A8H6NAD9_9PEZI|nr:terpene synthase metal binding domain-containing protein [Colletotrichum plurivorum]